MKAFIIATVTIKEENKLKEYSRAAVETMHAYGGKAVGKGKFSGTLTGSADHQVAGVFEFPSEDAIDNWYGSTEYQNLIPLRDEASALTITKYVNPELN